MTVASKKGIFKRKSKGNKNQNGKFYKVMGLVFDQPKQDGGNNNDGNMA